MKFLFDLLPVIAFVAAYAISGDIYVATTIIIPVALIQLGWTWLRHKKVEKVLLISTILIVVMGGLTLYLHDKRFIMWKPTILYWLLALTLVSANLFWKKNLIESLMGKEIAMPDHAWNFLNWYWVTFFIAFGFVNLYVAYNFEEKIWAYFKLWGGMGATLIFAFGQGIYMYRYLQEQDKEG